MVTIGFPWSEMMVFGLRCISYLMHVSVSSLWLNSQFSTVTFKIEELLNQIDYLDISRMRNETIILSRIRMRMRQLSWLQLDEEWENYLFSGWGWGKRKHFWPWPSPMLPLPFYQHLDKSSSSWLLQFFIIIITIPHHHRISSLSLQFFIIVTTQHHQHNCSSSSQFHRNSSSGLQFFNIIIPTPNNTDSKKINIDDIKYQCGNHHTHKSCMIIKPVK